MVLAVMAVCLLLGIDVTSAGGGRTPSGFVASLERPLDLELAIDESARRMEELAAERDAALARLAAAEEEPDFGGLPMPEELADRVELWTLVYGVHDNSRLILYHVDYPGIVYGAVSDRRGVKARQAARLRGRLYTLHHLSRRHEDPRAAIAEHDDREALQKLFKMFAETPGEDRFAIAARGNKIGVLRGRANELLDAHRRAEAYLPAMERIFEENNLPVALTRMVFVESMFEMDARSPKNAYGVWQFLSETAERYLVVDHAVDQRRDPVAATRAAARVLSENRELLGNWPLAVTAYNTGRAGMRRAVRATGSDHLPHVLEEYGHGSFGPAVENFYARLLAVIAAEKKLGITHTPSAELDHDPLARDTVVLPRYYTLSQLSDKLGMDPEMLSGMNPAWTEMVRRDWAYIPAGYELSTPAGSLELVRAALDLPPASKEDRANLARNP